MDLSSLQSYTGTADVSGTVTRTLYAINNGVIDMCNVGTIAKANVNDLLRFEAETGGLLKFAGFNTTGNVQLDLDGLQTMAEVANVVSLSAQSVRSSLRDCR